VERNCRLTLPVDGAMVVIFVVFFFVIDGSA
jgi:hypothetical protein